MNHWIFQASPKNFDIETKLEEDQVIPWYATRYRRDMRPGDEVFFWSAGDKDKRGIYAVGEIVEIPDEEHESGIPRVAVRVTKKLAQRVPAQKLHEVRQLENLLIFRSPIGSNFRLDDEEAEAIEEMILASA